MSLGGGTVLSSSLKQKLNVKIYTEGGLVGSHAGISVVLWIKHFIEAQGYTVEHKSFTSVIIVPYLWKRMGEHQAQNEQSTSRRGTFSKGSG